MSKRGTETRFMHSSSVGASRFSRTINHALFIMSRCIRFKQEKTQIKKGRMIIQFVISCQKNYSDSLELLTIQAIIYKDKQMQQRHLKQSRKEKIKGQVKHSFDNPIGNRSNEKRSKKSHSPNKRHILCVKQSCSARPPIKTPVQLQQKHQSSRASIRKQSVSFQLHSHQVRSPSKGHKSIKKSVPKKKASKKLDAYLSSKMAAINPSAYLDTTKSYNPQNHEFLGPHSVLIAQVQQSGKNVHKVNSQSFFNSEKEQISMQKMPSQIINEIPQSYQEFYDESKAVEQNLYLSRKEWEVVQTLKLKNEELNHYILELELSEQKLIAKHEQLQIALRKQFAQKIQSMNKDILALTHQCSKLNQTNAGLQEMFNQSKQQIDHKQNSINQLNQRIKLMEQQQLSLKTTKQQDPQYQLQVLTQQLKRMKLQCQSLVNQNRKLQENLSNSHLQKQKIKQSAVDTLAMLRQMGSIH